jgi:hypothetical protein
MEGYQMNINSIPQKLSSYDDLQFLQEQQRQKKCQICGHVGQVSDWYGYVGGQGNIGFTTCDNAEDCKRRLEAGK